MKNLATHIELSALIERERQPPPPLTLEEVIRGVTGVAFAGAVLFGSLLLESWAESLLPPIGR